jgi:hypothetical protein
VEAGSGKFYYGPFLLLSDSEVILVTISNSHQAPSWFLNWWKMRPLKYCIITYFFFHSGASHRGVCRDEVRKISGHGSIFVRLCHFQFNGIRL